MERKTQGEKLVSILKQDFLKRREKNPRYSLRAYSNFLGIDQSLLSKIFRNPHNIGAKSFLCILERLETNQSAQLYILESNSTNSSKRGLFNIYIETTSTPPSTFLELVKEWDETLKKLKKKKELNYKVSFYSFE